MFIIVRKSDNIIVGCANSPINLQQAEQNGNVIFEIDDSEFSPDLIGQKLESHD